MSTRVYCDHRDPETGECMRRLARCSCNPPRCYICGRFTHDWDDLHPECLQVVLAEEQAELRQSVEEQGLIA
jgi:hypothetical protein